VNVRQLFALENAKMAVEAAKLDACVRSLFGLPHMGCVIGNFTS